MNCRRVSSLVSAHIDGELTGVEMLEIRRHLEECRACMLQYESLRYTKQLLSRLQYAQPRPGFSESICARLDIMEVPGYVRLWNRMRVFGRQRVPPIAAGCAALGAVLVLLASHAVKQPDVIALHHPQVAVGGLSIDSGPATLTQVDYSFAQPKSSDRPLIPEPAYAGAGGSGMISFASFEGN
jgi:anti-sigma factor RsiW